MSESKLNKALYTDIQKLKLCSKNDAPVRFLLDKSPFNDDDQDDEMSNAAKTDDYVILGRIFPDSYIYNQGAYQIEMKLTNTFPFDPPEVRFITPVYHPHVGKDGKYCHDLLKKTAQWSVTKSLVDVVKAIVNSIDHPDIDYSLSLALGKEYTENRSEFDRKALEYVKKYALPRN